MTLTEDFTFLYTDTGVVLNTSPSLPFVDVHRVIGLDNAPIRETFRDHEGADGGFYDGEFEKGRELSIEGEVYLDATGSEAYLDTLKDNFSPSTTVKPFYFKAPGVTERFLWCKSRGFQYDWASLRRIGKLEFQARLYAEDPRIYQAPLQTVPVPLAVQVTSGFSFDFGFDFGFGGVTGSGDGATVTNTGNRPTPAIITIPGPVTDPQVINDTLGLTLQFIITLSASDVLTIDLGNKTVLLNGNTNRRNTLVEPNWFLLGKGATFFRYRAATIGSGPMTVSFYPAYR